MPFLYILRSKHFAVLVKLAKRLENSPLYGVQTKDINRAIKNNPGKFPEGYILEYSKEIKAELVKKFDQFNIMKEEI